MKYGREPTLREARVVREKKNGAFVLNITLDTHSVEVPWTPKTADDHRILRASLTNATPVFAEVIGTLLLVGVRAKRDT